MPAKPPADPDIDAACVLPDYQGACLSRLVPALLSGRPRPGWLPEPAREARQVVLLVLDGLGALQLEARLPALPAMSSMARRTITSVAPTTTAAALTSISTGLSPLEHGVVGYRLRVREGEVLNTLRWATAAGDQRAALPPQVFQPVPAFSGRAVSAVTRAEFAGTGFTDAHLRGSTLVGWKVTSTLLVEVRRLLRSGQSFVYAYYDGIDKVAHEFGFGDHYDEELRSVDRLIGDIVGELPGGAVLVVTSDHGQVDVGDRMVGLDRDLLADVVLLTGEARFRWLHARPGACRAVAESASELYGDRAWVLPTAEVLGRGWLGPPGSAAQAGGAASRLGDVAIVARESVGFSDPSETGGARLVCRHGSLTPAEMLVPLLALAGPDGG
ncbi:MAG: alkaline phosphatase family protein [Acidimicrobiales bacterium]